MLSPIAPRKAKIVYNFGLSECNRVDALKVKTGELANTIFPDEAAHNVLDISLSKLYKGSNSVKNCK